MPLYNHILVTEGMKDKGVTSPSNRYPLFQWCLQELTAYKDIPLPHIKSCTIISSPQAIVRNLII